jgi:hypothetical protein
MRNYLLAIPVCILFLTAIQATSPLLDKSQEYFDIRVENKCSHDVKLRIVAFGSASETTVYKNSSESHPVQPGYKLYVDGDFFSEIKPADKGNTMVICK